MSEEYGLKFVVNGEDYDKIKKTLNKQIEDLQQKVEQLEKENEKLKYLTNDSNTMKAFIIEHNKAEQLENIRKEAIGFTNSHFKEMAADEEAQVLLNILNKGE